MNQEKHDRTKHIGGSDIAAILGISPHKTAFQLYMEKTGQYVEEVSPQLQRIFDRGHRMEPYVVQWAEEDLGLEVVARNQRYTHPQYPFISCEIDFEWRDEDGRCQSADVKSVHPRKMREFGDPGTDEVPAYYTAQFLLGQACRGNDLTLCLAACGFDELRPYRIRRDEELIEQLVEKAAAFWEDNVQMGVPPPMTTLEDARIAFAKDDGSKVEATAEIAEMLAELKLRKTSLVGDQAKCDILELQVKKYMKDHTELVGSGGQKIATWKSQDRKSYTVAASTSRVFRLHGGSNE